jgi:Na+-driven multidrug efflux pump
MKTIGKIMFYLAIAFLVTAIVLLSLLIGLPNWGLGVAGLACVLAALIAVTLGIIFFLKEDDRHNLGESADDAPKAH